MEDRDEEVATTWDVGTFLSLRQNYYPGSWLCEVFLTKRMNLQELASGPAITLQSDSSLKNSRHQDVTGCDRENDAGPGAMFTLSKLLFPFSSWL